MLSNLPAQLTPFIGRQNETAQVWRLLQDCRLLTLTGPGGCGKTRLSLEAGRLLLEDYPDGVWLVDFSQITDPTTGMVVLAQAVAQALGVILQSGPEPASALVSYLQQRRLLLIMDNCEHVVGEVARLVHAILVGAGPALKIMATSQVPLRVPGEVEWLVPSLPFPEPGGEPWTLEQLLEYPAVKLFATRAAANQPGFQVTPDNAGAVIRICQQLDGIPLALELAAARVKFLGVEGIASRLGDRFTLLSAPRAVISARHQTLKNAVDWSFALLSPVEQTLLCRLAVFSGSWALEAGEAICSGGEVAREETMLLIGLLVDHSLVSVLPAGKNQLRYRLLETIRLYGLARLSAEALAERNDRHLEWYTRFAIEADQHLHGPHQAAWFDRLQEELPNLHAALQWAVAPPRSERRLLTGLKLAAALAWFWRVRGLILYGTDLLERLLAFVGSASDSEALAARAAGHYGLGWLYFVQTRPAQEDHIRASRNLWQQLGDAGKPGYALATYHLTRIVIEDQMDFAEAERLLRHSEELAAETGSPWEKAITTYHMGEYAELILKDDARAETMYRSSHAAFRDLGDALYSGLLAMYVGDMLAHLRRFPEAYIYQMEAYQHFSSIGFLLGIGLALESAGYEQLEMGNLDQAETIFNQAKQYIEKIGIQWNMAHIESCLGEIRLLQKRDQEAEAFFRQAISLVAQVGDYARLGSYLYDLAGAVAQNHPSLAARIAGCGDAHRRAGNVVAPKISEQVIQRLNAARAQMGEMAYQKARKQGEALSVETVLAPQNPPDASTNKDAFVQTALKAEKARYSGLTAREREIAVRIAQGHSNQEIARQMLISERTVTTHITNILSKLGFSSRTQVAAWVVEKGLSVPAAS